MEVKLIQLSGHNTSGTVGKLSIEKDMEVTKDQVLMQVETKKGNTPFKSPVDGKVLKVCVEEGQAVKIGDVLFEVEGIEQQQSAIPVKKNVNTVKAPITFDYLGGLKKGKKEEIQVDLVVIGGGPGGYVAAIYAAKQGLKTVVVEKEHLGGTCLNVGCIPTKSLVKSSEMYDQLKHVNQYGLSCENPKVDMGKVIDRKDEIKENLVGGIDYLLKSNDIKKITGIGQFVDENTVFVQSGRDEMTIKAKNIIIATGSKISHIPIKGIELPFVLNSTTALDYKRLPKSITIIGGGVIGMEFAFMYAQFGVEVKVVEYMPRVLSMLDQDVSEEITQAAQAKGIHIYTQSKVVSIKESESKEAIVCFEKDGKEKLIVSENVLVAIGREPNLEGLALEKAGVDVWENKKGIKVADNLQTNKEHIYAIGDVNNKIQLAHAASHQGMVAVDNILGKACVFETQNVPSVIFTTPEVAMIGIGEDEAKIQGKKIRVSKFPFAANGKALTMGKTNGFIKMIKDEEAGVIIGASIIGPDASTLVAAVTLIIQNKLTQEQVIETIFAHPTTGEVIHECTLGLGLGALHYHE